MFNYKFEGSAQMRCPACKGKLKTVDTIPYSDNSIYRRKRCLECGYLFYTIEFEVERNEKGRKEINEAAREKKGRHDA
mgnify:CR=1 FL=1